MRIYRKSLVWKAIPCLCVVFLLAVHGNGGSAISDPSEFYQVLDPEKVHSKANREITYNLMRKHYRAQPMDNDFSSRLLDKYINDLDRNRIYFYASDIREFEAYRLLLDDSILSNKLTPAYTIFNRFQKRTVERLVYMIEHLETDAGEIRFDIDESMEVERENAPWPETEAEMNDLWRKRLKGGILSQKMAGKSVAEAVDILKKRYKNQLNRVRQTKSEDAFLAYMNSVAATFDPHTQYMSPQRSENFTISMSLSFEGIGAVLQLEDEYVKILRLIAGGPAEKSRQLKPDDRIVGVAQGESGEMVDVVGWRIDEVVDLIRGPKGTVVRLQFIPADSKDGHTTRTVRIVRRQVQLEEQAARKKIYSIPHEGHQYKIGIIDIPTFYVDFQALRAGDPHYKSTTSDVRLLLGELVAEGVDGVVVDLRDNSGGSLQEAASLTGLFIDKGPTVQIRSARGQVDVLDDPDPEIVYKGPLAVVVNRMSASASEIFAAAIQDYQRGLIIGEQTFGKGTVQTLYTLSHGQLKNTSAKFYRISGESTQHRGVTPDIFYPSLYDKEKIGESSLEGALPWDTIRSLGYRTYYPFAAYLPELRERHGKRLTSDPDYEYLLFRQAEFEKMRKINEVSLNEKIRRQEQDELDSRLLAAENKRRKAKNLEPLASVEELEKEEKPDGHSPENGIPDDDPVLRESSHVLLDYLLLSTAHVVKN